MLDLEGKHFVRCGCSSLASPSLPAPAPQRTAAESQPLAHSRAAAAREGGGGMARGGGMAGMPVFPGRRGGEERGGPSRGIATRHSPIGGSCNRVSEGCLGFQTWNSPLSSFGRPGVHQFREEGAGVGILLSPQGVTQPSCSPRSSLQLGRSNYCLREHIPSLLLSRLLPTCPS